MPLKIYCPSCAQATEYTLTKPSFCSMCGNRFDGSTSIASQTQKSKPKIVNYPKIKHPQDEEIIEDNDEIIEELNDININALELDIPIDTQKDKGIKFEELAFQKKTGFVREKAKKVNKKKEFELFLSQAKNDRKSIEISAPEDERD